MPQPLPAQSADLPLLEQALGHTFTRPELLLHALTHRSQAYELAMETNGKPDEGERGDNERLEFLGDAVLGVVVAETLFQGHPEWQEGELTRMRAQLVSRRHMAEVALAIGLGDHLLLGKGEERSGGRKKTAILANAMEAVLAAMYLDAGMNGKTGGALEPVRRFARKHILGSVADDLARELLSRRGAGRPQIRAPGTLAGDACGSSGVSCRERERAGPSQTIPGGSPSEDCGWPDRGFAG